MCPERAEQQTWVFGNPHHSVLSCSLITGLLPALSLLNSNLFSKAGRFTLAVISLGPPTWYSCHSIKHSSLTQHILRWHEPYIVPKSNADIFFTQDTQHTEKAFSSFEVQFLIWGWAWRSPGEGVAVSRGPACDKLCPLKSRCFLLEDLEGFLSYI